MTSTQIVSGAAPSRPTNWLLRAGEDLHMEGGVQVSNHGQGRVVVLEVDSDNAATGAAVTELGVGQAASIPTGKFRRLTAVDNAALWFVWT